MREYTANRREEHWLPEEAMSCTGLHMAAMFGLSDIARELLPKYPIDATTDMGRTALIEAASSGFPDLVRLFLNMKVDPLKNNCYGTALYCAAEDGQVATIQTPLDAGVDVNFQDRHGRVPLWCAAQSRHITAQPGHTTAIRTLLDRGADDNFHGGTDTVLFDGVQSNEPPEVVQLLLDYGADPNIMSNNESVPLHSTMVNKSILVAQILLDHGAKIDTPAVGGGMPLHIAAILGHGQSIRLLLNRGAAIDAQAWDGNVALHFAAE